MQKLSWDKFRALTPQMSRDQRRAASVAGVAHALHDGYTDMITLMLPLWQAEFGLDYAALGLLRSVYVGTMACLAFGIFLSAIATSLSVMLIGRVVQGAGGAVLPLAFGIIRDEAPRDKVAARISIAAALLAVGGGAGIVLAGPIVSISDYHWLFWIPLIAVGIGTVAAAIVIPESRGKTAGRIGLLPAFLLSGWLLASRSSSR